MEYGYGKHLKTAMIRNFGKNLDNIFISWIDAALNTSHPPLLERLDLIQEAINNTLFEDPVELFIGDKLEDIKKDDEEGGSEPDGNETPTDQQPPRANAEGGTID